MRWNRVFDHKGWSNIQEMYLLKGIAGMQGTGFLHAQYFNYFTIIFAFAFSSSVF
jgi:hypothetical protein